MISFNTKREIDPILAQDINTHKKQMSLGQKEFCSTSPNYLNDIKVLSLSGVTGP